MKIHYVCNGNVFRSRLAEAYSLSLNNGHIYSSSGLRAATNENGPIGWYAARIAKKRNLSRLLSPSWTTTTLDLMKQQDIVVFLSKNVFSDAANVFILDQLTYEVWDIPDLPDFGFTDDNISETEEMRSILTSEKIFNKLTKQIDSFVLNLNDENT